jgi:Cu+-exporting ATPase
LDIYYFKESALAQIVQLVENAQMSKAPVQAYADKLSGIFTPVILLLGLSTFCFWMGLCYSHVVPNKWYIEDYDGPFMFSLCFAISVVVISCPCALGLVRFV